MKSEYFRCFFYLIFFVLIKAGIMIWVIQNGGIGLGPDEAQYWTWSQNLAWGYYSKPPGIAWQIWMGTQIFGNTELGVRFGSILITSCTSIALFFLAKSCRLSAKTCFWTGLVFTFSPLGFMGSLFAITDNGMFLFWTLACLAMTSSLAKEKPPHDILLGILIFAGALFKWPIYIFWLFVPLIMFFYPFCRTWKIIRGMVISLLGLLPSIIWNSQNEWVTFRHVFATIHNEQTNQAISKGNFIDFFGSQIALLSPILFILLGISLWVIWQNRRTICASLIFCALLCFLPLSFYFLLSFVKKIQGNWCLFAYPTGIVILCWCFCEKFPKKTYWLQAGTALSILLCGIIFSLPTIQEKLNLSYTIPYGLNPFRHNMGWNHLSSELSFAGYNPNEDFTFGDKYQTSSILSFYSPGQKRSYFLNLHGIRKNQFSFWPGMAEEQKGKTGFFILTENAPHLKDFESKIPLYEKALAPFFQKVELVGIKPIFFNNGVPVKQALIFKCIDYNGNIIKEPELY